MEEDPELIMELMRLSRPALSSQQSSSSSSSSSPLLQEEEEEEEVEQPLMSPPLPTHPMPPSSTTARSIRCKGLQTTDAPLKRKRGVLVGAKAAMIHRTTGEKIKVEYDEFHKGPANPNIRGMISRDIGTCVRTSVPMEAPSYMELDKKHRKIVEKHLLVHYHIPVDHDGLWDYVQTTAADRYKEWKFDCRQHWLQYKEEVPLEFLHRAAQWEWLCTHFKDPKNMAECARMKKIRNAPKRMNHHSGTTAFSYRAKKHEMAGHPAPFVRAFEDAYAKDGVGAPHVEAMKQRVEELVQERRDKNPEIPAEEPLPLDLQLSVITTEVGDKGGTVIRGVGRCMQREPKKRGGCSRADVDALVEKRVEKRVETLMEEVAQAKEELRKEMKEFMAKVMSQHQFGTGTQPTASPSNPT